MRRARDRETNILLYHTQDGGPLYVSGSDEKEYFCRTCDREGRDPYVQNTLGTVNMGKPSEVGR